MKCRAYPNGAEYLAREYNGNAEHAAYEYANDDDDADNAYDIVVEPVNDEARERGGEWDEDDGGPFLVFRAEPPEPQPWTVDQKNKRRAPK